MYLVYYTLGKNSYHIGSYERLEKAQESIKLAPIKEQPNYVIIESDRPKYEE